MTVVSIDLNNAAGSPSRVSMVTFTPSMRLNGVSSTILPDPVTVQLTAGVGSTPDVVATDDPNYPAGSWAYRVVEYGLREQSVRYVLVPTSTTAIPYSGLVEVDPATLDPIETATAAAIWGQVISAKGDLIVGSAASAVTRLPIGTPGQYPTPDPLTVGGIRWADLPTSVTAGSDVTVWDGNEYPNPDARIFVGPQNPGVKAAGKVWFRISVAADGSEEPGGNEGGGPLLAGQRAAPGLVGYLGAAHSADRTIDIGDTLPAELAGWFWDGSVLRTLSGVSDKVLDGWRINAGIDYYGTNLTVRDCVITPPAGQAAYGIYCRQGTLVVEDCTVTGAGTEVETGGSVSGEGSGPIYVTRCDLSGFQDGAELARGVLSQVYIHDIAQPDSGLFHSDGVQIFGGGAALPGIDQPAVIIEHCYIDARQTGLDTAIPNSAVFTDVPTGVVNGFEMNNCYINGGGYVLRLNGTQDGSPHGPINVVITNNKWGDEFVYDETDWSPNTDVTTWSGNVHADNSAYARPVGL